MLHLSSGNRVMEYVDVNLWTQFTQQMY